jgi:hypothetical protein
MLCLSIRKASNNTPISQIGYVGKLMERTSKHMYMYNYFIEHALFFKNTQVPVLGIPLHSN